MSLPRPHMHSPSATNQPSPFPLPPIFLGQTVLTQLIRQRIMIFQITRATNLLLALKQRPRTLPIIPIDIFLAEEIQGPLSRRPRRMLEEVLVGRYALVVLVKVVE